VRYRFGRFVLSPARRVLYEDGHEVGLIPRYFDLLVLLVEQRNRAVHRQEIFDRVWADVVVSDGALTQAIRTIRRVLGDDPREPTFIRTVSRHGYQFVWAAVAEEADAAPVAPAIAAPAETPLAASASAGGGADLFAPLVALLLKEGAGAGATEDERYDAAVRLHELGTDEALRRIDERPGHEEARAILRDARWNAPQAGPVPLLAAQGRVRAIADVVALRLRHAARIASARWAGASVAAAAAGAVAGVAGGVALALVPGSQTGAQVALPLAAIGGIAGAAGGAGIGAGLAAAEALARSARGAALASGGALAGWAVGGLAHHLARALLGGVFGRDLAGIAGGLEGLVLGGAVGAGYAVATRRLSEGGMAAPRGPARWRAALVTGVVTGLSGLALAAAGRHLVGSSLDLMAGAFNGSQVGLDPLARLLGEDSLRPITRALVSGFEGAMFGTGLAFGLMRRPKAEG
jgi:DNA-binding winged helix-turn-helix (wHTH) protein